MQHPHSESIPDAERQGLIDSVTREAASYLGLDLNQNTPVEIVTAVNETIVDLVFGRETPIPNSEDPAIVLGCLWGSQMIREMGWSWINLHFDGFMDVAVVSPSRDMAIYPFTFAGECIGKLHICTVALSFNMLRERKGEAIFPPDSYQDVMSQIRHIVPPYTLEPSTE